MRKLLVSSAIAAALVSCTSSGSVVHVQNQSDFAIVDIRFAPVGGDYGRNLLAGDTLNPGEEIDLAVDCGTYDAEVTDETGAVCTISDVDLCANDAVWVLTNSDCPVFGSMRTSARVPSAHATPGPAAQVR